MEKITQKKLSKRLAQYGALATAIAGVSDVHGQISYTDESPDFAGGIGSEYFLDLDGNGTDDFRIYHNSSSNLYISPLTASNKVLGSGSSSSYAYPFALSSNAAISSSAGSWFNNGFSSGYQSLNYGTCSYGNWCSVTNKYLGLRFNIGGSIHYGWARLDVDADGAVWTVKDYAYNITPLQLISAGQTALGVDDHAFASDIKIVALNKSIGLYNLGESTNYKVYAISGKSVLNGTISDHTHVIEASALASGVYIIELSDNNSNGVIRKKIVL